jgi:TRAP-type C4-dicarboxylate transport system substrate-binding protein
MMKKLLGLSLGILLVAGLILGGCASSTPAPVPATSAAPAPAAPAPAAAGPITLSMVMFLPDVPPGNAWTHLFMDKVAKYSNGALTIKLLGGPEAIPPMDAPSAVQRGTVDIANSMHTFADSLAPGVDCIGRAEYTPAELRKNGTVAFAQELFAKAGIYYLGASSPSGPQNQVGLFLNKVVSKFDDLKGLKIAAPGGDHKAMIEAFGSTCLPINFTDFYTGMERHTIDGYTIGIPGISDFGLAPVTACLLDETFTSNGAAFMVNLNTWNKLPQNLKDVLTKAAIETEGDEGIAMWDKLVAKTKQDSAAAGVKIVKFSHEDSVKFYKSYRDSMNAEDLRKNPENVAKFQKMTLNPDFARLK